MIIWIDADSCPKAAKEILFRAANRLKISIKMVANHAIPTPRQGDVIAIRVDSGPDVADDYIAERAEPVDVVITSDIPLAARIVELGALALSPRGVTFTEENISERLSVRDFMHGLRETGVQTGGAPPFDMKDKQRFANALDRVLSRRMRGLR